MHRPPVATERLVLSASRQVPYRRKTPFRDGTTHLVLDPLDLMARLAARSGSSRPSSSPRSSRGSSRTPSARRRRLIDAGAGHAKKNGFAASGMDAIAAAAKLTSGSLYRHFSGKSELFASVMKVELRRTAERFAAIAPGDQAASLRAADSYLSLRHVDHPEQGCPLPSLTAEVARADDPVRCAFESGVREIHAEVERLAGSSGKAWALIAQTVGAVMIARAMLDAGLRNEVLSSIRKEVPALPRQPSASARKSRRRLQAHASQGTTRVRRPASKPIR